MKLTAQHFDQVLDDYRRAFEVANGKPAPLIKYENGWFRFKDQGNKGYRRFQLEKMTKVLRERFTQL